MAWGPADWDALTLATPAGEGLSPCLEEEAVRGLLDRLPGRRKMTVADLGCGRGHWLPFLARRFERVVAVDYAPATLAMARRLHGDTGTVFRRRDLRDLTPFKRNFHVALLMRALPGPSVGDLDRILAQVWSCFAEGGLLVASVSAASRRGAPVPMRLAGDPNDSTPRHFTEVDLQYRLRKAGFMGIRLQRFAGDAAGPDVLLAVASRRANN